MDTWWKEDREGSLEKKLKGQWWEEEGCVEINPSEPKIKPKFNLVEKN